MDEKFELAIACQGIAINHPDSKFNSKTSKFYDGISGYEFIRNRLGIYVSLLTLSINSFDVIYKDEHVLGGYGPDVYVDDEEGIIKKVDIEIYKEGIWKKIIKDIYNREI